MEPLKVTTPSTEFDWAIYADATFAGLSVLIPIPLLDLFFEWFFRQRMPTTIAKRNGRILPPDILAYLSKERKGCMQSCLALPLVLTFVFLKRLSRKILYFLTIKEASDQLSFYWHRAFLLNYMVQAGYLADTTKAKTAAVTLDRVLASVTTSPLVQLAQQTIAGSKHIFRTLRGARRGQEDQVVTDTRSIMARTWSSFGDYFVGIANQYTQLYPAVEAELKAASEAAAKPAAAM